MNSPVLTVENLTLAVVGKPPGPILVDAVGFSLDQGKTTAMIGESGSGKSLTAMSILGLLPPGVEQIGGRISMNLGASSGSRTGGALGSKPVEEVVELPLAAVRGSRIGLIMQNPASCFDPLFTIRSHFRETLAAHGIRPPQGQEAYLQAQLWEVGLAEPERILDAYPFQLSGGMLQRVMIALSLLPEPLILLADEPFSSLDVWGQKSLMELLLQLQAVRGFAMLVISHDIGCAQQMAQDVVVMHAGKVVEYGLVENVFQAPASLPTKELLAAHKSLDAQEWLKKQCPQGMDCDAVD